jgi:hypothetical protein
METYTKINTLYKRFRDLNTAPNPKWKVMQNKIIPGCFSDESVAYLAKGNCLFEGYSKIDGTNSKICYFPSTGKIQVGGKTDKANSQHGQFEMLQEIADRIKPELEKMFPKESAKFAPVKGSDNKVQYYDSYVDNGADEDSDVYDTFFVPKEEKVSLGEQIFWGVKVEEVPVYIYGEYFGQGVQKCGSRYYDHNDFAVFDINAQGWWVPKDVRDVWCKGLSLKTVPFIGIDTISGFESKVIDGFTTRVEGVKDPSLIEEGIVCRPVIPVRDSRNNRIIVKIKYCDYKEYNEAKSKLSEDEYQEFVKWYNDNIEPILDNNNEV